MLDILGNIVLFFSIALAALSFLGLWVSIRSGGGIVPFAASSNLLFILFIVLVMVFQFSPFHLIWLFPLSFILGFYLIMFEPVQELLLSFLVFLASIGRSE